MPKRQVFYSFYFDDDVMRVQQIRNMGVIDGDEPVSPNEWEKLQKKEGGVKKWIDDNMANRSCVVVLVGENTAGRPWVKYEIRKAWEDKKGLLGVYIHNLSCPKKTRATGSGTCKQGKNPFDQFNFKSGDKEYTIKCHNPKSGDAYNDIKNNIGDWIEEAIKQRA